MSRISFKDVIGETAYYFLLWVLVLYSVHCHLYPKFSLEIIGFKKYTDLGGK